MKTTFVILFLFLFHNGKSQSSDLLFVPQQNSIVVTFNPNNIIGLYGGGFFTTSFPQPYTYTTPFTIINRLGLSVGNNKLAIMGGIYSQNPLYDLQFKPDVWLKINPIRFLTRKNTIFDLSLGMNYSDDIRWGIGLSIMRW